MLCSCVVKPIECMIASSYHVQQKSLKKACGMGHVFANMFEALYARVRASEN